MENHYAEVQAMPVAYLLGSGRRSDEIKGAEKRMQKRSMVRIADVLVIELPVRF
jgi:hypothetical protein